MLREPYRIHFALGFILGLIGVALWPLYLAHLFPYPMLIHRQLMLSGMFLSFVTGFLMTAAPRMTGAEKATPLEILVSASLLLLAAATSLIDQVNVARWISALQILWLAVFMVRRFLTRTQAPPAGFLFVPCGLLWAVAGFFLQDGVALQQAFLLNLILGIGSRLIPFLTRTNSNDPQKPVVQSSRGLITLGLALNASFFLSYWIELRLFYILQAVIIFLIAMRHLAIFKPMHTWAWQAVGIRTGIWTMILTYILLAIFPEQRLALLHLMFIASYGLITLMIATRVILAHGGHELSAEVRSKALLSTIVLLLLAASFRSQTWIASAATFWLLALLLWFWAVGRKVLRS